jgi:hypothetical protein
MTARPNRSIGQKAAQTSYYAPRQAEAIGLPFTHMVTINFALTNVDPRMATAAFALLRTNYFAKWARRPRKRSGPAFAPTWSYAFENSRDGVPFTGTEPGDPHNIHVHWCLHIPPSRVEDFSYKIWEWVETVTGGITDGTAIDIRADRNNHGYLIKAAPEGIVEIYGRGVAASDEGVVIGLRADSSRNIGPTRRRERDRIEGIRRQMPVRRPRPDVGATL